MKWPDKIAQVFTNPAYAGCDSERAQYSDPPVRQHSDVALKTWTAVSEVLSRRDYRTQPGVLTPGKRSKEACPEGATDRCDRRLVRLGLTYQRTSSTAPLGRAVFLSAPGVKTPGSVLKSLRDINSRLSTFSKPHHAVRKDSRTMTRTKHPIYPGLKTWAILLSHFMATTGRRRSQVPKLRNLPSEMTLRVGG
jgi:hypothetical protein